MTSADPDLIHWKLDGKPIKLSEWEADVAADVGYRTMTAKADPGSRRIRLAEQETPIVGYRADGSILWGGKLTLDPSFDADQATLTAEGPIREFAARADTMLYRIDGGDLWVVADSDPYGYAVVEKYDIDSGPAKLLFVIPADTYANGNQAGFVLWTEGDIPYSLIATMHKTVDLTNFELQLEHADGPAGSLSNVDAKGLGAANPDGTVLTWSVVGRDLIRISIECTGATSPGTRRKVWLTNIMVTGQRTQGSKTFTGAAVLQDVFSTAGLVPDVDTTGQDVMPIYWTDPLPDLASYVCGLLDWRWRITNQNEFGQWIAEAGPWERVWRAARSKNARGALPPMARYNHATVPYTTTSGVDRFAEVHADPDPFPNAGNIVADESVHGVSLVDKQPDSALADAAAAELVQYYSSVRHAGDLELAAVWEGGREASPFEVPVGDLLLVQDHDPEIPAQRIAAMKYRSNGQPVASLSEELNTARMLAELATERKRKGRRRRHRHR